MELREIRYNAAGQLTVFTTTLRGVHLPVWLDMGYQIIVTSDHGMDDLVIMEEPCQNTVKFPC